MSKPTLRNFIGSNFVESVGTETIEIISPATEEVVATSTISVVQDVDLAFETARVAFKSWGRTTPRERHNALLKLADAIDAASDRLVDAQHRNTGQPRAIIAQEEIAVGADQIRLFAGAARHLEDLATSEYLEGLTSSIRREPIGVVAQITPWNYPFMMAVWKIAPALAAGNTIALKPSDTTPESTLVLAEITKGIIPDGVFNVVLGDASTGTLLAEHPVPGLVSITGSVRAGQSVAKSASVSLKRVHLELGGKAAAIVFPSVDIIATAGSLAEGAFFNGGQDCTAVTRIIVHESIRDEFVAALVKAAEATVTGVRQDDSIIQEETFGPVVTVQTFTTAAEALEMANVVQFGLASSVWTSDHATAMRFCRELNFGAVWINTHIPLAAEMPHGGFGRSGYGKDLSAYGFDDYTRIKHVMSAHE